MRLYRDCYEMVREVERDLWEMGILVHPQTMQDKDVSKDGDYRTKELRAYGFTILPPRAEANAMVEYLFPGTTVLDYCRAEHSDRISGKASNPGNSYKVRGQVWGEFLHEGKFSYTYSERFSPQLPKIIDELRTRPETRQAIVNIHSNFYRSVVESEDPGTLKEEWDLDRIGGKKRIPCSLYYQFLRREGKLEMIYAMRSCDFLTHFPVDIWLALEMQDAVSIALGIPPGNFTYFTGSLHAYSKDMKARGIF